MNIIHMDTELARDAARRLDQSVSNMHDLVILLKNRLHKIDWQGSSCDDFMEKFERLANKLVLKTEDGLFLSQRLAREVDEWEEVASELSGSANTEYEEAIKRSSETLKRTIEECGEMRNAKAAYEKSVRRLYENEGMKDMENIQGLLKKAGITDPLLVNYWSFQLYVLKRLTDATGIPALVNALIKLGKNQDLSAIDHVDLLVLAAEEGDGPLGVLGNIWESIKESAHIGDAIGGKIVLDKKAKVYVEAINNCHKAQQEHEEAWDAIFEAAPQ